MLLYIYIYTFFELLYIITARQLLHLTKNIYIYRKYIYSGIGITIGLVEVDRTEVIIAE